MASQNAIFAIFIFLTDENLSHIKDFFLILGIFFKFLKIILGNIMEEFTFFMWQKMAPEILPNSCSLVKKFFKNLLMF